MAEPVHSPCSFRRFGSSAATFLAALFVVGNLPALRAQSRDEPAALLRVTQDSDGRGDYRAYRNTQAVLVMTRTVLAAALQKPGAADLAVVKRQKDPVAWLRDSLEVDFPRDGEVLRIALKGADPREAALLVNAVADSYLELFVSKDRDDQARRLDALKAMAARSEEDLRAKRRALRQLTETAGTGDGKTLALKERYALERLGATEKELLHVQSELRKAQVELQLLEERRKKSGDTPPPDSEVDELIDKDPVVQKLLAQVADLKASAAAPITLESTQETLEARRKSLRRAVVQQLQEKKQAALKASAAALRERIQVLQVLEKTLADEVERLRKEVPQATGGTGDTDGLRDEIAQAEAVLKKVSGQVAALEADRSVPPRVILLEKAEAPRVK